MAFVPSIRTRWSFHKLKIKMDRIESNTDQSIFTRPCNWGGSYPSLPRMN